MTRGNVSQRPIFDRIIRGRNLSTFEVQKHGAEKLAGKVMRPRSTAKWLQRRPGRQDAIEGNNNRKRTGEDTLETQFKDAIEVYRAEIASEVRGQLFRFENDLSEQLAKIGTEFSGKLRIMADWEDAIFDPIAEERLENAASCSAKHGIPFESQASLRDRVGGFEKTLVGQMTHLKTLWSTWQQIQLEITCLAVEFLGPISVDLAQEGLAMEDFTRIKSAIEIYHTRDAKRKEMQDQTAKLEQFIHAGAEEAITTLDKQEKAWKTNEKQKIRKIRQIMMDAD